MARSAEGLPIRPNRKPKVKKKVTKGKGNRTGNRGHAPKGNQFWRIAMSHGPDKKYTPAELLAKAQEYFDWVDENPLERHVSGKNYQKLKRPYTIDAFCLFAGIDRKTFDNYSEGIGYQEYFQIMGHIRNAIRTQKFEGAAAGIFNAAIIARDLGLVDKQERDVGNKGGTPFQTENTNKNLNLEITPDMDEKTASQIYRSLINPPKPEA